MLDIDTGEQTEALYRMVEIKGGKRINKFSTPDIKRALRFHRWYVKKYHTGLYMEILPKKKIYDWKNKKVEYNFE